MTPNLPLHFWNKCGTKILKLHYSALKLREGSLAQKDPKHLKTRESTWVTGVPGAGLEPAQRITSEGF